MGNCKSLFQEIFIVYKKSTVGIKTKNLWKSVQIWFVVRRPRAQDNHFLLALRVVVLYSFDCNKLFWWQYTFKSIFIAKNAFLYVTNAVFLLFMLPLWLLTIYVLFYSSYLGVRVDPAWVDLGHLQHLR